MKTTSLFVELVVIGIGTFLWVALLFCTVFDLDFLVLKKGIKDIEILILGLGLVLIYVFGIAADRVADEVFGKKAKAIRKNYFSESAEVLADKVVIYANVSPLVDMIDYGRSRMRICRGWLFNLCFILIVGNLFLGIQLQATYSYFLFFNLLGLILIGGLYFAWQNLLHKEYGKLKEISQILRTSSKRSSTSLANHQRKIKRTQDN